NDLKPRSVNVFRCTVPRLAAHRRRWREVGAAMPFLRGLHVPPARTGRLGCPGSHRVAPWRTPAADPATMAGVRYHRRLTIDDQIRERYLHVPLDVPPGTSTLSVRLRVADAEAVVDLGCVAPRRWCGWAGAARSEFVIGHEQATPGFLPGWEPGTWHVVLGLRLLPPGGAEGELEGVLAEPPEFAAEPLAPVQNQVRGSAREIPAAGGLKWFAGDFHAHTTHSDGSESIDELAARAAAAGLDFLAVTDHNTTSHHRLLPASARRHGITLIPGQEVTTAAGHACAYGDIGWVDFRTPGAQWLEQVERAGGLLSLSHPLEGDCSWQHHLERAPHAVEL